MRRSLLVTGVVAVMFVLLVAGCGGGGKSTPASSTAGTSTEATPSPLAAMQSYAKTHAAYAGTPTVLFQGSEWSVVQTRSGSKVAALAFHLQNGAWHADTAGVVKITILGPQPGEHVAAIPQVAIGIKAPVAFEESALWVDGTELFEKGGGTPTEGTIYGAPAKKLAPGTHAAVGYARTGATGTAVAWLFRTS